MTVGARSTVFLRSREIFNWYSDQILASPLSGLLKEPRLANGFRSTPFIRQLLKKYESHAPKFSLGSLAGTDALCTFLVDALPATGSMLPVSIPRQSRGL